jgi:hypothetical protein
LEAFSATENNKRQSSHQQKGFRFKRSGIYHAVSSCYLRLFTLVSFGASARALSHRHIAERLNGNHSGAPGNDKGLWPFRRNDYRRLGPDNRASQEDKRINVGNNVMLLDYFGSLLV